MASGHIFVAGEDPMSRIQGPFPPQVPVLVGTLKRDAMSVLGEEHCRTCLLSSRGPK